MASGFSRGDHSALNQFGDNNLGSWLLHCLLRLSTPVDHDRELRGGIMLEPEATFPVPHCAPEPDWSSLVNVIRNPQPRQLVLEEVLSHAITNKYQIAHSPARMRFAFVFGQPAAELPGISQSSNYGNALTSALHRVLRTREPHQLLEPVIHAAVSVRETPPHVP